MSFRAVIFDMDGVLIDSELHWDTVSRDFFEARGVAYHPGVKKPFQGQSLEGAMTLAKKLYGFKDTVEALVADRMAATDHIYEHASLALPGAGELLQQVKTWGYKQAIASGSFLYRIEKIVRRFGWKNYLDALISADHVGNIGKPAPDIYLHTAYVLGVPAKECIVFEDSENGVVAAKAAGMTCVAVTDPRWSHGDFSRADYQVHSLADKQIHSFIGR